MALQEELERQGELLFRKRGVLPLIILVAGLGVYAYNISQGLLFPGSEREGYYSIFCLAISLFGLAIRMYTVGHTPRNTSGRNTSEGQIADEVNTTGIYSVVRHPLYVGNFFMWFGIGLLTQDVWFLVAFVLLYWIYYERIMFAEEQFLRKKFGPMYTDWAETVPAFIPRLGDWKKSSLSYSFRKAIYREKSGTLWVFLAFYIFATLGHSIETGEVVLVQGIWLNLLLGAIVYYITMKTANLATGYFNEETSRR